MSFHYEVISTPLKSALVRLMSMHELESFRLVGGTALALLYGHRSSVDIDLFAAGGIDINRLSKTIREQLEEAFILEVAMQNGISGRLFNVKVDLFDWKVPFIHPPVVNENIRLAAPPDIFAYKCEAIIDRKSEKDFCDIGEIMKYYPIEDLIDTFRKRYPFISIGAVFPILLKKDVIVRDKSIQFFNGNSFDAYAEIIRTKINTYEQGLLEKKIAIDEEQIRKIQELIEQKRNKQK